MVKDVAYILGLGTFGSGEQQGPLMICSSGMNNNIMRVDGNIERHFLTGQRILFEKDIVPFLKKVIKQGSS